VKREVEEWFGILLVLLFMPAGLAAQDAKVVEAAKKEGGKVVVYGSSDRKSGLGGRAGSLQ
jgi:hypothetical protein